MALVAAAGRGTRLGAQIPKAYVELRGKTLLERSVQAMINSQIVDSIVITVSAAMEAHARQVLDHIDFSLQFIHGGGARADSVWAGLQSIPREDAVVLIHDAARALTPPGLIARVATKVLEGNPAVIPVVPVSDTIKSVDGDMVQSTPDRSRLRAVQTPQGFDLARLRQANEAYFSGQQDFLATDDASLMEWFGQPVVTVHGDPMAFKITTPIDMTLAHTVLDQAEPTIFEVPSE